MDSNGRLPRHIAMIMDGNGRWARRRGLPRTMGHRKGLETVENIIEAVFARGIECLSLFAFSTENWERPQAEIEFLLSSFREYLQKKQAYLMKNAVRLTVSGRRNDLGQDLTATIEETETMTAGNTGRILNIAFNYGGRAEIADAAARMAKDLAAGAIDCEQPAEELLRRYLYQSFLPDIDLLIRTSGEQRISNFMLWQLAYAELYFTDVLWPDFTGDCLDRALATYAGRERRFGRAAVTHESRA